MARTRPTLKLVDRPSENIAFLRCRALRSHTWDVIEVTRTPSFGRGLDLRCTSCGTVRHDLIGRNTGELLARYYDHPIGYKDVEKRPTGEFREAYLDAWEAQ